MRRIKPQGLLILVPGPVAIAGRQQCHREQIARDRVLGVGSHERVELGNRLGPASLAGGHHPARFDRHIAGGRQTIEFQEQWIEDPRTVHLAPHPSIQGRLGPRVELRLRLGVLSKPAIGQGQRISDRGRSRRQLQGTLEMLDRGLEIAVLQGHLTEPDQARIARRIQRQRLAVAPCRLGDAILPRQQVAKPSQPGHVAGAQFKRTFKSGDRLLGPRRGVVQDPDVVLPTKLDWSQRLGVAVRRFGPVNESVGGKQHSNAPELVTGHRTGLDGDLQCDMCVTQLDLDVRFEAVDLWERH